VIFLDEAAGLIQPFFDALFGGLTFGKTVFIVTRPEQSERHALALDFRGKVESLYSW